MEKNGRWKGGSTLRDGYRRVHAHDHPRADKGGYVREHILVAEKALGKYLPPGAVVHHINGIRDDNRPANLVICQDVKYHNLLHMRARALAESGDPSARHCHICKKYGNDGEGEVIVRRHGKTAEHRDCVAKYSREIYWRRKARQHQPTKEDR